MRNLLFLFTLIFITPCDSQQHNEVSQEKDIDSLKPLTDTTTKSLIPHQPSQISDTSSYPFPSLEVILNSVKPNMVTSSTASKPKYLTNCFDTNSYYGVYHLNDDKIRSRIPTVANVTVSFNELPWFESDTTQVIISIFAWEERLDIKGLPCNIGDSIQNVSIYRLTKKLNEISFFSIENYTLALKSKDGIITKLLYFNCNKMDETSYESIAYILNSNP